MRVFNLAEELEKERKKNKELEEKLKLAKEQDLYGIKLFVSNETYNKYKGTLQDQINELQDRIDSAIIYMERNMIEQLGGEIISYNISQIDVKKLLKILKGSDNNE